MAYAEEEAKLQSFLQWLQANNVELRGCRIKYCGHNKGFGVFYDDNVVESNGVIMVVPLDLAITSMRVLQDPSLGPKCRAMCEEGGVDDRFLMILFLMVERLRENSVWKPYLDMLPTTFGNPLWFTDDELLELKGTTLYRATELQKKSLQAVYEEKVKGLVMEALAGESNSEVCFKDFLWANSIFWTRALNIPFPHSYVVPQNSEAQENCALLDKDSDASQSPSEVLSSAKVEKVVGEIEHEDKTEGMLNSTQGESIWLEGLVPGIDFCNHDIKPATTWEVDGSGTTTGVRASMYLLSVEEISFPIDKEVFISYGSKGNEELLYLYGFVIDNNPDDFLMVHYPVEALQSVPFADAKSRLLEVQNAELRCLLPRSLLDRGFFSTKPQQCGDSNLLHDAKSCNFSWSGQREMPSYSNNLVFPEDLLTALRTIAMKEEELNTVQSLLEELIGSDVEKQPSDNEVRAAIWEACGDSGALQLLVDLLQMKMAELEEGSGTEACDTALLEKAQITDIPDRNTEFEGAEKMSRNRWSSIVYRRGQKQLTRSFLMEAEHTLQVCLSEEG